MISIFRKSRGSILVTVLVILAIMSLFAVSVAFTVRQKLKVVSRLEAREKLRHIAEAGVMRAIHTLRERQGLSVDAMNQTWSHNKILFQEVPVGEEGHYSVRYEVLPEMRASENGGTEFRYGMVDEESKINLNKGTSIPILTRLFRQAAGLSKEEAHALAQCVFDWRDEDDHSYDQGAETRYYQLLKPPYHPKNADLGSLEELLYVKGMSQEILERIRPYVTLDGNKEVNINTASKTVLLALGFEESAAQKIFSYRKGKDKEMGTGDDGIFQNPSLLSKTLQDSLGYLTQDEIAHLDQMGASGLLSTRSEHFMIQSVGSLTDRPQLLTLQAVIHRTSEGIKRWREEYSSL